jgi:hypothetical protein
MSKLPILRIPTMSQTILAVEGNTRSGVVVAQIKRSTSCAGVPVLASNPLTAAAAMCEVPSPSPLRMRRSLMPVRSLIHSSLVSSVRASVALSRMSSGT